MKSLFPVKGSWFKGMLHVHSTESDGWILPERVLCIYSDFGFDFVCLTDHWKVTPKPEHCPKHMLYLYGAELNGGKTGVGDYHIVGVDFDPDTVISREKKNTSDYSPSELVNLIKERGGLAMIAHPSWNGVSWVDLMDIADELFALEVWNTGCDEELGRGVSEVEWDDLLSRGKKMWGTAVDDAHNYVRDSMKGWVMVKAPALTRKAVRTALEKGSFYSTTGPMIKDIQMDKEFIVVKTSPVKRIDLVCNPTVGRTVTAHEGTLLEEYTFHYSPKYVRYFRIRIRDAAGNFAWSNPVFVKK
jgi:hypothetical protein